MSKNFLVLILLTFCLLGKPNASAQEIKEYRTELSSDFDGVKDRGLKGNVQSIKTIYCTLGQTNEGDVVRIPEDADFDEFDQKGKLISYVHLGDYPVYFPIMETDKTFLKYDDSNTFHELSDFKRSWYNLYDDKGNFIESWEVENGVATKTQFAELKYDRHDRLLEDKTFWVDSTGNELDEHIINTYDNDGNLILKRIAGGASNLSILENPNSETLIKYDYDADGNNIEMVINAGGNLLGEQKIKNKYNDEGMLKETEIVSNSQKKIVFYEDGRITNKYTTRLNDRNEYKKNEEYLYKFDDTGNWILLNIYIRENSRYQENGSEKRVVIIREITYYP